MKTILRTCLSQVIVILCLCCTSVMAAQNVGTSAGKQTADRIDGLVLDQTVTLAGHEFYLAFVSAWREQAAGARYNIVVRERPSARLGNQVWVEYRFQRVYQGVVRVGKRSASEAMSAGAAQTVSLKIAELEAEAMFRVPDMASDEI